MATKINLRLQNRLADELRKRAAAAAAAAEGVSLNTLIVTLIAGGIAYKPGKAGR